MKKSYVISVVAVLICFIIVPTFFFPGKDGPISGLWPSRKYGLSEEVERLERERGAGEGALPELGEFREDVVIVPREEPEPVFERGAVILTNADIVAAFIPQAMALINDTRSREVVIFQAILLGRNRGLWPVIRDNDGLFTQAMRLAIALEYQRMYHREASYRPLEAADGRVYWRMDISYFIENGYEARVTDGTLDLTGQPITHLDGLEGVVGIGEVRILILTRTALVELPTFAELRRIMPNLQALYLDGTQLDRLPDDIGVLGPSEHNVTGLRILNLHGTQIRGLPESIIGLTQLLELDVENTRLEALPEMGGFTELRVLNLNATLLQMLPRSINDLQRLEALSLQNMPYLRGVPNFLRGLRENDRLVIFIDDSSIDNETQVRRLLEAFEGTDIQISYQSRVGNPGAGPA